MSLLKTKPRWAPTAIATDRGWVHPNTGEVFVAIGNLKTKLEAEQNIIGKEPEVIIMDEVKTEVTKEKRTYNKKPKVIGEVVEQPKDVKIIGEVVEYDLETPVVGE